MSRNRSWIIVLAVFLGVILVAMVAATALFWAVSRPAPVARDTVIELSLGGTMRDLPSPNPLVGMFEPDRPTLFDYWGLLDRAAADPKVKGIYLEIQPMLLSWAQIEELREGILKFKESGKPVHAFLASDMPGELEMYLATATSSITMNPDAALLINGLLAEVTFYKGTMDKLGIRPQFIQYSEFKSPEVYERTQMSPAIRSMYESILGDMDGRFVDAVAADRKISSSVVREAMGFGLISPQQATDLGLIDTAGHRSDVFDRIRKTVGKISRMKASKYMASSSGRARVGGGQRVALVSATGLITSGSSDPFAETLGGSSFSAALRKIREEKSFDAVLMRVDSPGGSAVGSDMVWREVQLLREAGIPVVVSMSGVAGSGGYYIAMAADHIISQPTTITGSIGVIFGKFDIKGLAELMGISIEHVKLSPNADLFSPFASMDSQQMTQMREWVGELYEAFVKKAADGRGMEFEDMEAKARGRIYTGVQAKEIGLVDELGGFNTAIEYVKKSLGLELEERIRLIQYPPRQSLFEALSDSSLFQIKQSLAMESWAREQLLELSTPAPRLITPEIRIR